MSESSPTNPSDVSPPPPSTSLSYNTNGRARRKTAKTINYAMVETAADLDDDLLLSDEEDDRDGEMVRERGRSAKKSAQKAKSRHDGEEDEKEGKGVKREKRKYTRRKDKYDKEAAAQMYLLDQAGSNARLWVEKGYDPDQLPIRQRYTFSQEFEVDGSPSVAKIIGRRPVSKGIRDAMKDATVSADIEGLSRAKAKAARRQAGKNAKLEAVEAATRISYEYLVKFKGVSYLHCQWYKESDLGSLNKSAKTHLSRYLKKLDGPDNESGELEDPVIEDSWVEVEKIMDVKEEDVLRDMNEDEIVEYERKVIEEEEARAHDGNEGEGSEDGNNDGDGDADMTDADVEALRNITSMAEESHKSFMTNMRVKQFNDPFARASESTYNNSNDDDDNDNDNDRQTLPYLRARLIKISPLYHPVNDNKTFNPYADGLVEGPPRRPRQPFAIFFILNEKQAENDNPLADKVCLLRNNI
jgi:hypothetical protein